MTPKQIKALRAFAKDMIGRCWEGCEGGDEIQDLALTHDLIVKVECTKANRHVWSNIDGMEDAELGDYFYQLADWLKGTE